MQGTNTITLISHNSSQRAKTQVQCFKGNIAKAPDSPEVMHCFDDRYK